MKRLNSQQLQNLYQAANDTLHHVEIIDGIKVEIMPNLFSNNGLCMLLLNNYASNSCRPGPMKKLLAEWDAGKRHVKLMDDGNPLLMINYDVA